MDSCCFRVITGIRSLLLPDDKQRDERKGDQSGFCSFAKRERQPIQIMFGKPLTPPIGPQMGLMIADRRGGGGGAEVTWVRFAGGTGRGGGWR